MRAAAAAFLVLLLALPAWGAPPPRATLLLQSRAPLVVHGRGFGDREHVALTAVAAEVERLVTVRAGPRGSFLARFPLWLDRCERVVVRAIGAGGSRAILQVQSCGDHDNREGQLDGHPSRSSDR
jgi:hypothetical protein